MVTDITGANDITIWFSRETFLRDLPERNNAEKDIFIFFSVVNLGSTVNEQMSRFYDFIII